MYSNCLIEAIKAKIKEPKNVHIFRVPKRFGGGATHFMWYNEKTRMYYHSVDIDLKRLQMLRGFQKIKYTIWHEQKIKEINEATFNAFILRKLKIYGFTVKKVKKAAKKMYLYILKIDSNYKKSNPDSKIIVPNIDDVNFLRQVFRKEPVFKVVKFHSRLDREFTILTYDELIKCAVDNENYVEWKFIGIDDEEFTWLYAPCCDYATADDLNQ